MQVRVEFLAQLRTAAGLPERTLELNEGATVADLLALLARDHGAEFHQLALTERGAPQPGLLVAVDGARVAELDSYRLVAGARVLLGTAIAGG